jgi:carbonic anhydrase
MRVLRRFALTTTLIAAFAAQAQHAPAAAASAATADPHATPAAASTPGADELWQALHTGNTAFVAGKMDYDDLTAERKVVSGGQNPPVTVVSCSDSRVLPELVFGQSIGALFIIRTAGNLPDTFGIASVEYGVMHGWTKLIVVLGHEECGAVKAAMERGEPGTPSLDALVDRIRESFYGVEWDPKNKEAIKKAVTANARSSAASLLAHSTVIRDAVADGKIKIIVAYYSLSSGEVTRVD